MDEYGDLKHSNTHFMISRKLKNHINSFHRDESHFSYAKSEKGYLGRSFHAFRLNAHI